MRLYLIVVKDDHENHEEQVIIATSALHALDLWHNHKNGMSLQDSDEFEELQKGDPSYNILVYELPDPSKQEPEPLSWGEIQVRYFKVES